MGRLLQEVTGPIGKQGNRPGRKCVKTEIFNERAAQQQNMSQRGWEHLPALNVALTSNRAQEQKTHRYPHMTPPTIAETLRYNNYR